MTKPKLTMKQAMLVKGIAGGKTKQEAGIDAGYGSNPESTSAIVSETLKIPKVQEAIEQAMVKLNLTPERVLKPIDDALNDDDVKTRLMGTDRALKLMNIGQGKDDSKGNTYIFNKGDIVKSKYVKD